MSKSVKKLHQLITEIDAEQFYGEDLLWAELASLASAIREKLQEIGWRLRE